MGVDMSELVSMDISGPLLTHEGMDNYISKWYGRYLKDYEVLHYKQTFFRM